VVVVNLGDARARPRRVALNRSDVLFHALVERERVRGETLREAAMYVGAGAMVVILIIVVVIWIL
jgi:hypothetical protein